MTLLRAAKGTAVHPAGWVRRRLITRQALTSDPCSGSSLRKGPSFTQYVEVQREGKVSHGELKKRKDGSHRL